MTFPDMPAPRWGTLRNPQRETLGPQVAKVAEVLGWEMLPWQRYVVDVGCEIDPATGLFWYSRVRCLAPRQQGKTSLIVPKGVHRAITTPRGRIVYTAQNGRKAKRRLEENFYNRLVDYWRGVLEPKRDRHKPGWNGTTGSEAIDFTSKASIYIDSTNERSGQGDTNHEWLADELYAHQDGTVANNISPTMITVPGSQAWEFSAAGRMGYSNYWWGLVADGRAIAEQADPRSRVAYFEWSDDPEADREDRSRWPLYLPAYGILLFEHTMEAELEALASDLEQYDRAYRGIWSGNTAPDPIIPREAWKDDAWAAATEPIDFDRPFLWSIDVSPDHEYTSIGVAGAPTGTGSRRVSVGMVAHELGTGWALDFLTSNAERYSCWDVAVIGGSAAAAFIPDLEKADFTVRTISRSHIPEACGAFYADAVNRRMWHDDDEHLNQALAGAVKRNQGDAWVWWRGKSMGDVSPAYAVTAARHVYLTEIVETDYDPVDSVR